MVCQQNWLPSLHTYAMKTYERSDILNDMGQQRYVKNCINSQINSMQNIIWSGLNTNHC